MEAYLEAQEKERLLIRRAQEGDKEAFGDLITLHYTSVCQVLYHYCGDRHLAEDAAQEAFLKAWLKITRYQPKSAFRNWLYRIAINCAHDILRDRYEKVSQGEADFEVLADRKISLESSVAAKQRAEIVRKAIGCLPEASRAVLILREYGGLSYNEIAVSLDLPLGTVMSRLNYARNALKRMILDNSLMVEVSYA